MSSDNPGIGIGGIAIVMPNSGSSNHGIDGICGIGRSNDNPGHGIGGSAGNLQSVIAVLHHYTHTFAIGIAPSMINGVPAPTCNLFAPTS